MNATVEKETIPDGITVEWNDTPERYNFDVPALIDHFDLESSEGFIQVFDVDTRWFSITRWTQLINGEIDGSEAAVVERDTDDWLLVVYSKSLDGANYVKKRVDGKVVLEIKNIEISEHLMEQCGDISYFAKGKAENVAEKFGSYEAILDASVEELADVKGMSKSMAQKVYDRLHE